MLFSADSGTQSELASLGWSGVLPLEPVDRLAIVDSNIGWSKSDRNIVRAAKYAVDLSEPHRPVSRLTLSYRHEGLPVSRRCNEHNPPAVEDAPYSQAKNACYWDYFRAYVAVGSEVIASPEFPLPISSTASRLARLDPGSPTFAHEFDANGDYFAGMFSVEPGDGRQFDISYRLPVSVLSETEHGYVYRLDLVAQPGARGRPTTVEITLPPGHALADSSEPPVSVGPGVAVFEFDLTEDVTLRVETSGQVQGNGDTEIVLR
jgi:hypothetical protein